MKVTLFMAFSTNGYIARENGEEDFLSHENWRQFAGLAKKIGCFVVGRKTYEVVRKLYPPSYNFNTIDATRIVISKRPINKPVKGYVFVNSPSAAIRKARELGFDRILLAGGSTVNSSFIQRGLSQ